VDAIGDESLNPSHGSGILKDNETLEVRRTFCTSLGLVTDILRCRGKGLSNPCAICIGIVVEGKDPIP
jgi:hypothetical protein